MGGNGQLIVRGYNGALQIINHDDDSGDGDTCIDMASGVIKLESSVTAGLWPIRGICTLFDNSTGTANVIDRTINQSIEDNATALGVINEGVKKASILVPHRTDI